MEYRVIRTGQSDDHIEHALFGGGRQKGAQNKNHKYLARAWWQNKWRYAYTQAEVAALQNLGKAKQAAKDVGDKAKAGAAKVTKTVSDVASGKYARDVDSRADRYAESAAQRSAASKRQSSSARDKQEQYRSASRSAEENRAQANRLVNKITGQSKTYNKAADAADERAERHAAEGSRLTSMSRENSAAARSDAKKAAEAEAEKNTAAYKISKAAGNVSRAADKVSDTARDVGNRVSNAASDAKNAVTSVAERGRAAAGRVANKVSNAARGAGKRAIDAAIDVIEDVGGDALDSGSKASKAARDTVSKVSNAARGAASKVSDAVRDYTDKKVLSGQYAREVDEDYNRSKEDYAKQRRTISNIVERNNKLHDEYNNAPFLERVSRFDDTLAKSINQIDAYERANKNANASSEKLADAIEKRQGGTYKVSKAIDNAQNTARKVTDKGKAAVERLLNRASNAARGAEKRATDTINRATDSIDRAVDKVKDTATTAARKAAAQSVKMEYGAESPQYRAAKAQVDYDKAVDDLSEARDKYGVNSSQYKQAMRNEAAAREEKNEALKAAKLDSRKSNSEKAKERITSAASSASEKGKAAVEKLFNRASSAVKSAGEKVTDAASKAYGNAKTQIDLAENAINESRFDRYGENRIKNAQKKIDSIDKELADYEKEAAKDSVFKEENQGWLRIKQRERAEAVKELSEAKKWQKDWEDSDKTLYRMTDEVSDMNPNMRKSEPITSSQRKAEIKEQNLYKYNSDYRKASDRASEIGSYLDNWDARGGPQTTEGKASYNKMMRELKQLESELEKMRK